MPVFSSELGLSGECDMVELHRDANGIPLRNREGKFRIYPVEYKHGAPKEDLCDVLQLTAQAMCLEDMLCCSIAEGALYYFETRHRLPILFTEEMRETVRRYAKEMHEYFDRRYLPKPKRTKACNACSLKEECLPRLEKVMDAQSYNDLYLGEPTER
jgi:CRISPR-associated exonuclease Cas4